MDGADAPPGTRESPEPDLRSADENRRRIIDALIKTGVPAVAAAEAGRRKGLGLATLYALIPLLAIGLLFSLREQGEPATTAADRPAAGAETRPGAPLEVSAQNIAFNIDELTLSGGTQTIIFENRDASTISHNMAIYEDAEANDPIFQGEIIRGGTNVEYEFTSPRSGEYLFQCDVHPSMNGTVVVKS